MTALTRGLLALGVCVGLVACTEGQNQGDGAGSEEITVASSTDSFEVTIRATPVSNTQPENTPDVSVDTLRSDAAASTNETVSEEQSNEQIEENVSSEEADPEVSRNEEEGETVADATNPGGTDASGKESSDQGEEKGEPVRMLRLALESGTPEEARVTIRNVETEETWQGEIPNAFELPPGRYTWTVRKEGYFTRESESPLDLRKQSARLRIPLSRTVIEAVTDPDSALVTLRNVKTDEEWQARAPHTFDVPPGRYEWTAEKDGYNTRSSPQPVDFQEPPSRTLRVPLSRKQRSLRISTAPDSATVVIRNTETGEEKKAQSPSTFRLTPGRYTWRVRKEGYATKEAQQPIDLRGESKEKRIELSRKKTLFDFATTPDSALVTIRNAETGQEWQDRTPVYFKVPSGQYSWSVQKRGYGEKTSDMPVEVREDPVRKKITLSRKWPIFRVKTVPEGASVTLRNVETGEERMEKAPYTFAVPPGQYEWVAEKEGYATQESKRSFSLGRETEREERIKLTQGDVSVDELLKRGRNAFKGENYRDAINAYEQVPEPAANQDNEDYLRAQFGLGQSYFEVENYQEAIDAFEGILKRDPTRYDAHLNLAKIYYEIGNYDDALQSLDRVTRLKRHAPASRRQQVQLQVDYFEAQILYQQFQNAKTSAEKRTLGLQARQKLQSFIATVPADLKSSFQEDIEDAKRKLEEIRSFLSQ